MAASASKLDPCQSATSLHASRRITFKQRICFWLPLVVPILYVGVVFAVQPEDHMGPPDWAPEFKYIFYDDGDLTAYLQRALSARLGQVAGLPDNRSVHPKGYSELPDDPETRREQFAHALNTNTPLERLYFLEYPHTALYVFRLGFLLQPEPRPVPAVVVDTCYINICSHRPQNEGERELWMYFRRSTRIHFLAMLVCYYSLVLLLRSGYLPNGDLSSMCLVLVLPSAIYFTFNRFDAVPVVLTAASMWCLGRRRVVAAAVFLAFAAAFKVYAILLAPLILRYLWSDRRTAFVWTSAFGLTLGALLAIPLCQFGWEAFLAPYRVQLARKWIMPMTIYDALLPAALGGDTPLAHGFRLGSLLGTIALLALPRMPDFASLLRRSAVVLLVFQSLLIFFSPQFILWLVPFLLPLGGKHRGLIWLVVLLDLLNWITFPAGAPNAWLLSQAVLGRYLLLGTLVLLLLFWDSAARRRLRSFRQLRSHEAIPPIAFAQAFPDPPA